MYIKNLELIIDKGGAFGINLKPSTASGTIVYPTKFPFVNVYNKRDQLEFWRSNYQTR
jgi:hypothetical protein